jgi:hypothetical protein
MHKLVFEKRWIENNRCSNKSKRLPNFIYIDTQCFLFDWFDVWCRRRMANGETASDTSYINKPVVHRVTNIGNKLSRLIGILNLGKGLTSSLDSSEKYLIGGFGQKKLN